MYFDDNEDLKSLTNQVKNTTLFSCKQNFKINVYFPASNVSDYNAYDDEDSELLFPLTKVSINSSNNKITIKDIVNAWIDNNNKINRNLGEYPYGSHVYFEGADLKTENGKPVLIFSNYGS